MAESAAKRIVSVFLAFLLVVATTAQQALGIVSTVANLVDIVEGRNTAPVQVNQPIVEGATYRATGHSAAEFTFPEGLRAAAGPSSSVAFHPSPAGAGTRLVSVSEGLFRFQLPNAGERVDVQTPYGAFRAVSTAPDSEIVVQVGADGNVQIAATKGRVEIRDFSSGALLLLLEGGQGAVLASNPAGGPMALGVVATGPIAAGLSTQVADLNGLLSGQFAAAQTPPAAAGGAAGDAAASESGVGGATVGWALGGAALIGGIVAAAVSGGGGDGHGGTTTTTTTGD